MGAPWILILAVFDVLVLFGRPALADPGSRSSSPKLQLTGSLVTASYGCADCPEGDGQTLNNDTDLLKYQSLWQGLNKLLGKEKVTSAPAPLEDDPYDPDDLSAFYDLPMSDEEAMIVPDKPVKQEETFFGDEPAPLKNTSLAWVGPPQAEDNPKQKPPTSSKECGVEAVRSAVTRLWWVRVALITAGLVCNLFSVLVLAHRDLRAVSVNILTQGLAVADLVLLLSFLLATSFGETSEGAARGLSLGCRPLVFFLRLGITWTMLMVVAVSADRFIAVCLPLHRVRLCQAKWAPLVTGGLMVLSMIDATLQTLLVANTLKGVGNSIILGCEPSDIGVRYHQVYGVIHSLLVYVLPWLVVCSLNICIIWRLRSQRRQWRTMSTAKCLGEFRVNVSLVVICISFAVLCLPDVIFMVLHAHTLIRSSPEPTPTPSSNTTTYPSLLTIQVALREAGDLGYILQTLLYPIALLGVGTKYKQVILSMFCGHSPVASNTSGGRTSSSNGSNGTTPGLAKWTPVPPPTTPSPISPLSLTSPGGEEAVITFTFPPARPSSIEIIA